MKIVETLPSKLDQVNDFISLLLAKLSPLSLNQDLLFNIKLSLHESIINAIKHGNKLDPNLKVKVEIVTAADQIMLQVTDQGKGFDFEKIPNPITPENLVKLSGRGIFMIQNAMDKVEFADQGRTIQMIKFLR